MKSKRRLVAAEPLPLGLPQHRKPLPPELCEHLGFMIAKAHQEIFARMGLVTAPTGLTPKHFGILLLLQNRGSMRQTDVADTLRTDRTTIMKMIDELEGAGFVKRGTDPTDRRANAVKPTAKGTQWLEKLRPAAEDVERQFLDVLSADEQRTLRELLTRLVSHTGPTAP
jgi:DNA-binding MarR family transcriptional regulator